MPLTSSWKRGLPWALLAASLLGGCSKKPPADSQPGLEAGATNLLAPSPPLGPPAPGPNAGAKEYVEFGAANGARHDYAGAIVAFDTAISLDPKYAPAYYWRGFAKSLQDKPTEATQNFDKAIQLDPNYRDAYYHRGIQKGLQGDFEGAIADFQQVIHLDPKFAPAYYSLGHAYYFQGDQDGALAQIEKSLALDEKSSYCYFIRGLIRHAQGDCAGATSDFEKSLGLNFPDAAFWLFICETEDSQPGIARKDLSDALSRPQVFPPGDFSSAVGMYLLGQISQTDLLAKAASSPETQQKDATCAAWFYAGISRRFSGDLAGAKDCFTNAIATDSKSSEEYLEAKRERAALPAP